MKHKTFSTIKTGYSNFLALEESGEVYVKIKEDMVGTTGHIISAMKDGIKTDDMLCVKQIRQLYDDVYGMWVEPSVNYDRSYYFNSTEVELIPKKGFKYGKNSKIK